MDAERNGARHRNQFRRIRRDVEKEEEEGGGEEEGRKSVARNETLHCVVVVVVVVVVFYAIKPRVVSSLKFRRKKKS